MSLPRHASAAELAAGVRDGRWTSRALVERAIARGKASHARLNAWVDTRFETALAEADAADQAVANGDTVGPLHGVPCTIKEAFAVEGMSHTAGLVARRGHRAEADAPTVARLRAAGAVVLGVSNTSELCMWMESCNRLYGQTNNAYDPRWTAGGSSGGEGALVGSGVVPFGLGSDVGGSIRMPSFFNGIFGHKPSPGLVPNAGQFPGTVEAADWILASGPMASHASDLPLLLEILATPVAEGPVGTVRPAFEPSTVDLASLTVFDATGPGAWGRDSELTETQRRAAAALRSAGMTVRAYDHPAFGQAVSLWAATLGAAEGKGSFRDKLGNPSTLDLLRALPSAAAGRGEHTFPAVVLGLIEDVGSLAPALERREVARATALREELTALLQDGVLLYPSHPYPAPNHHRPVLRPTAWADTALFNAMGLPVTQVPLGLSRAGRPLGVQVVGAPGADAQTLAVALSLEEAFGGWVPPAHAEAWPI